MKKTVMCLLASMLGVGLAMAETITVAAGGSYTLASDKNKTANVIGLGEGATLEIPDGMILNAKVKATGATATIKASSEIDTLYVLDSGIKGTHFTVENVNKLVFGSTRVVTSYKNELSQKSYPLMDANLSFSKENAVGLVLTNSVVVGMLPATCTIVDDAWVGILNDNALTGLGMDESGVLTLDTWNAFLMGWDHNVFMVGKTVKVASGRIAAIKPAFLPTGEDWNLTLASFSERSYAYNVELLTADSKLVTLCQGKMTMLGKVTGMGDVEMVGAMGGPTYGLFFPTSASFVGTITVTASNRVCFAGSVPGHADNTVRLEHDGAILQFNNSVASVSRLEANTFGRLFMAANQVANIGTLGGALTVEDASSSTGGKSLEITNLEAGAKVVLKNGARLKIDSFGANVVVAVSEENPNKKFVLDLTAYTGENTLTLDIPDGVELDVLGTAPIVFSNGGRKYDDQTLKLGSDFQSTVQVGNGTRLDVAGVVTVKGEMAGAWTNKVCNWFDASAENALSLYTDKSGIVRWYDRRRTSGTDAYPFLRAAVENAPSCMPKQAFDTDNDFPYITMGQFMADDYRFVFYTADNTALTEVEPKHVICVFGSQNGGGWCLFSVNGGLAGDSPFYRGNYAEISKDSRLVKTTDYNVSVDGVAVDGTATGLLDGGWQIISMDFTGGTLPKIRALGENFAPQTYAGGQNFAEVIFFNERLSERERLECEAYLAAKWGLREKYKGGAYSYTLRADGSGAITVDADVDVLEGGFHGTLTVNSGKTVTLSAHQVPGEEVVASTDCIAWFDPCHDGALKVRDGTNLVQYLYGRSHSGLEKGVGEYALYDGGDPGKRAPIPLKRTLPGTERVTWLDFENVFGINDEGNTLRSCTLNANGTSSKVTGLKDVRQAFMVVDSSRGGGNLMNTDVNFDGVPGKRVNKGMVASDPIWKDRSDAFADVATYLDNRKLAVDAGFSERPEILSVEFNDEAYSPGFFGYYGAGNAEILGEMIFYSQKLDDETRTKMTAYLMRKWVGAVLPGYSDLSRMTLAGAGHVVVPKGAAWPKTSTAFTGTLTTEEDAPAFTIDAEMNPSQAIDACVVNGTLNLPASGMVTLKAGSLVKPGTYTLISADAITGVTVDDWQIAFDSEAAWRTYITKLHLTETAVQLEVLPTGTLFIIR